MKSLIKNQLYLATHQIGFWLSTWMILGYVILTFLYYCAEYFGIDAGSTLDASELYAFHGDAPYMELFSRLIPFICVLNFGYQNAENKERGTYHHVSLRVSAKEYWKSMTYANLILTCVQFEFASFLSMLLNRITFQDTGCFFEGTKGCSSYWKNITGSFTYRWNEFHMQYPWLYIMVFSLILAVFCMGLSHMLFGISLYIKNNGLWIFVVAGAVSLLFFYMYYMEDYDVWGDVTVYSYGEQSGIPTLIIWISMILIGNILIANKLKRWEHEE